MNLGEFHTLVSTALNRGTTLDTRIPAMTKLAAQWMERNYTFKYMERFKLLQVMQGDRTVLLPANVTLKGMKFLRIVGTNGRYHYIKKIEPEDSDGVATTAGLGSIPATYWLVANGTLVFGAIPGEDLNGEAMWYEFTDWPVSDSSVHFLLTTAADVMLSQTLLNMAAFVTRDARMVEGYKAMRDESLNTLTRSEDEIRVGGEPMEMQYNPI